VWQVRKIWATADLKPHRLKTFKISSDPNFAEKVIDIVGVYIKPARQLDEGGTDHHRCRQSGRREPVALRVNQTGQ